MPSAYEKIEKEKQILLKSEEAEFIGRHVLLDAQTSSTRGIDEINVIYQMLDGLSKVLDMTLVYPPIVARFPFSNSELEAFLKSLKSEGVATETIRTMDILLERRRQEASGISGIVVWLESHAAIHTWPEEYFFSFDAFSCKDFNTNKLIEYIVPFFDLEFYKGWDIVRTIKGPRIEKELRWEK